MNNKKRAIELANLLLERRFLIKEQDNTSQNQFIDNDGNKWYYAKNKNGKWQIYVTTKSDNANYNPNDLKSKNITIWNKISQFQPYFIEFNDEGSVQKAFKEFTEKINISKNKTQNKFTDDDLIAQLTPKLKQTFGG